MMDRAVRGWFLRTGTNGMTRHKWVWFWEAAGYIRAGYKLEEARLLRWRISTQWYPGLGFRNFL